MTELVEKQALIALVSDPLKERLRNTLREQLDDALVCTRTWDAWRVGTYDDEYIDQLANAILLAILNKE